ncbi:3'-5' exonuclease [Puniceicoccaceae bacterium K14]|nr:3'-5' exonuclease [Puniceicoccaceae bacterium K14]
MKLRNPLNIENYHPLMGICEIVVFDLETTGLRAKTNEITQIAAARIGGLGMNTENTFSTFVNPGMPIPELAQQITHISDENVKDAPPPLTALQKLCSFSEQAVLFGHDVYRFDFKFINKHLHEDNTPTKEIHFIDTMDIFQILWPDFSRLDHGLDEIADRLNVSIANDLRHRADGDVELLTRIFHRIQADDRLESITQHVPVHTGELPCFDPSLN